MSGKFKKYMNPYTLGYKLLTLVSLFFLGLFVGLMIQEQQFSIPPLIVFGIVLIVSLVPLFKANAFFRSLDAMNTNAIEQDFARAYPFVKGKVRMGQSHIYAKGSGKLVAYGDMVQVYQHIHRTNGIEDKRMLKYVDANGKHQPLCQLRLRGKSDSEVKDILTLIRQKNPGIKIGV